MMEFIFKPYTILFGLQSLLYSGRNNKVAIYRELYLYIKEPLFKDIYIYTWIVKILSCFFLYTSDEDRLNSSSIKHHPATLIFC